MDGRVQATDERVQVVTDRAAMQETAARWRHAGHRVGLVPTMGALHEGHLSLVRRARGDCGRVTVSVFVNPLQFGPAEDLDRYPRDTERDLELLAGAGADVVYLPRQQDMYPPGATTRVRVHGLDERLEGAHRPGHFEGVATVVTKLFNAALPHRAYFGRKDAQQAALVTRLARDLDTGVEVVVLPTVRDEDGVALSSRNAYLSPEERRAARCLVGALRAANAAYQQGERDPVRLRRSLVEVLTAEPLAHPDYAEVVDSETFESPGTLAVLAVRIGRTRLIDNHPLGEPLEVPSAG